MPRAAPPFVVHSIAFAWSGAGDAVPLRDPATGEFTGDVPEWTADGRRDPAAYPGGSRPAVRVVFARAPGAPRDLPTRWVVGARGHHGPGISRRTVELRFDRRGLSGPHEFRLDTPLPAGAGELRPHWHWHVAGHGLLSRYLGTTRHVVYHTWRSPLGTASWAARSERETGPHGRPDHRWVYTPVMRWTCRWAARRRTEKSVCDAILLHLPSSRLKYAVAAWHVGEMLLRGGGYCGGWYRMFQAMAAAQGVHVERRSYLVDWRVEAKRESRWCAIVVRHAGINRDQPAERASTFHDADVFPRKVGPVAWRRLRRYRFWGHPGGAADGHCINVLEYRGRAYLYDASFRRRPVSLGAVKLPSPSTRRRVPVERLGAFKRAYLDGAVEHMLGSLLHGGRLYRTEHPDPCHPQFGGRVMRNGLTVRTALIPAADRDITFYWTT